MTNKNNIKNKNDTNNGVLEPEKFAFKTIFKKWNVWVILPLINFLIILFLGYVSAMAIAMSTKIPIRDGLDEIVTNTSNLSIVTTIIFLSVIFATTLYTPLFYQSLEEIKNIDTKTTLKKVCSKNSYKGGLKCFFVMSFIILLYVSIVYLIHEVSGNYLGANDTVLSWIRFVGFIVGVFLAPFISFIPYYFIDKREGIMSAVKGSFIGVKNNYAYVFFNILAIITIGAIVNIIPIVYVIYMPYIILSFAYVYDMYLRE